jgi:hypothetical protein
MFEVRKGIPLPVATREGFSKPSKYPFSTMDVGDMFFVPAAKKSFSSLASAAGKRLGRKFSTRAATENGVEGIGCWRVE